MLKKGRKYYRIGEVSQIVGVEPHVLRFWEKEFRQIQPRRISGRRLYRHQDLAVIKRIKDLLYKEGYTIAGARKRLERERASRKEGSGASLSTQAERRPAFAQASDPPSRSSLSSALLNELKEELLEIKRILKGGRA